MTFLRLMTDLVRAAAVAIAVAGAVAGAGSVLEVVPDACWNGLLAVAVAAVAGWAFWRLNETPGQGDWVLKLSVLGVFGFGVLWELDRWTGNAWRWDSALFMCSLALALWAGPIRHWRHERRREGRGTLQE